MPKSVVVTLDGKEFKIAELRSRQNALWRGQLEDPFKELASMLENGPETDISDLKGIGALVRSASGLLLRSVDMVKRLLVEYAPELADVVEEAYDSEIMEAFGKVLELAYPFGGVVSRLKAFGSQSG